MRILLGAGNWSETYGSAVDVWNQVSQYISDICISSVVVSFKRGVYRILLAKREGKRPLGRPKLRCENNSMVNLQVVGCGVMDWIELAPNSDK